MHAEGVTSVAMLRFQTTKTSWLVLKGAILEQQIRSKQMHRHVLSSRGACGASLHVEHGSALYIVSPAAVEGKQIDTDEVLDCLFDSRRVH